MKISGFQKTTLLDYPNLVACIIFTQGCNFKCGFCHNSDLLPNSTGVIEETEIFEYLNMRKKILDGVVISGGEPTIQKDLKEFIKKIKTFNLKVKLDTNGTNPKLIKELIEEKLVDYIAMDIKNNFDNYDKVIGTKTNIENIKKSIDIIKNSNIDHEFRTTIMKNYHNLENIKNICELIGNSKYYLQNFKDSENVLDKSLKSFTDQELKDLEKNLISIFPNVKVRGI